MKIKLKIESLKIVSAPNVGTIDNTNKNRQQNKKSSFKYYAFYLDCYNKYTYNNLKIPFHLSNYKILKLTPKTLFL